jgi:hypothetical protein
MNAMVITPKNAKYSNAYKLGMRPEKLLNTFREVEQSWDSELVSPYHNQVGDFWGSILLNFKNGGDWLVIDEIFHDWILDPNHVYRRPILRRKMPQWTQSTDRMERHYAHTWNPSVLERNWHEPTEDELWAFPKSQRTDNETLAKECIEYMTDKKNIGINLRRKNNLSVF